MKFLQTLVSRHEFGTEVPDSGIFQTYMQAWGLHNIKAFLKSIHPFRILWTTYSSAASVFPCYRAWHLMRYKISSPMVTMPLPTRSVIFWGTYFLSRWGWYTLSFFLVKLKYFTNFWLSPVAAILHIDCLPCLIYNFYLSQHHSRILCPI